MVGQTFSHYKIIKELGRGGMGVVYLAEDTELDRQVAIKISTEASGLRGQQLRMRFRRELKVIAKLSHRNIAIVHDGGKTPDGQLYIVMELLKGKVLGDLIKDGSLTIERVVEIILAVAEALAEAHRHGIIHRDIKPSNIAINEHGDVKVLDFGLAKYLDDAAAANQLGENSVSPSVNEDGHPNASPDGDLARQPEPLPATRTSTGVIVCTPEYASPEQAMGCDDVDARSDLFSLGTVLYECLTGTRPFSGPSPNAVRAKVIRDDPPPPSTFNSLIPPALDRITLKALAKKQEARYQSARELILDLVATRGSMQPTEKDSKTQTATDPTPSTASWPTPQTLGRSTIRTTVTKTRIPVLYVVVALMIISLVSWGVWRLLRTKPHQPSAAAQHWYEEGTKALHDGTYYKASKMFEEAIKQDDKFALAHARLAEAWAELGYFEKANAEISQANLLVSNSSLSRIDALYVQAINATLSHNFSGALESYRQMVPLAEVADKPHLFVDLGRAYEKSEDLPNAIANYKEAIKSDSQYAAAFLREGVLYGRLQDFVAGEGALDIASALYKIQSNPEGMTEVLYQRGVLFNAKGDTQKAREPLEQALGIVRTFTNPSQEAKTLLQLSSVYRLSGDTETAKKYANEARDLSDTNGLSDLKTQSLIELGYAFFFRSEIADAEKYFKQALEHAQSDKVRVSEARAQFALGSMHIQQDEADEGMPFIKQALPFYEQNVYRKEIMQCQTLLGQAHALKGEYPEALHAFESQLRLAQELNNQLQIGLSRKSIGTVLGNQERCPEALDQIEQSYSVFNSLGNKLYVGYSLISRADMKWRMGKYDDAAADLNLATSLAEQPDGKFKQLWGRIFAVKGPMGLSQKDFGGAIKSAQRAIASDDSRTRHPAIEAQVVLGLARFFSGDKRGGRRTCEQAAHAASDSADPKLVLRAFLALAEVMIESGDAKGALSNAMKAQELANHADQIESEWRALLIAGRASQRLGDYRSARDSLLRADNLLSALQQRWGTDNFTTYVTRPDVAEHRSQLIRESAAAYVDH